MNSKAPQTTTCPDSTELSSKKTIGHWRAVCPKLAAGTDPALWEEVLEDFYWDRLKTRYLEPINAIKSKGSNSGEGFAIVTIQCSLLEFLESCYTGMNYRHTGPLGQYEYSKSGPVFVSFLTEREPFKTQFDKPLATDFYEKVRCGLLHEARTKGAWVIRARTSTRIVDPVQPKPTLNRNAFQEAILEFIRNYRNEVPKNIKRQAAFIRKFNDLCLY
jgi:hypothetical protein